MADPYINSVWLRPPARGRGAQPTLGREQIVRAAIELLDAEGLDGLSMRRLGTRLGAGATSLYWHVSSKDELLELAVDDVLAEVYVPEPGDASFRMAVSVYANGMRAMLLRHPWVIPQLGTRPNLGPNAMRVGDRLVAVYSAAGFDGIDLSHASSVVTAHVLGAAATACAVLTATGGSGATAEEVDQALQPYLDGIAEQTPHHHRWRKDLGSALADAKMWEANYEFGLDRILDGLELWLSRQAAGRGPDAG